MKTFLLQNLISLLCFICIIITLFFSIKNYIILKREGSISKTDNKTKQKKNYKAFYSFFTIILIIIAIVLLIVPYTYKRCNELRFENYQLQRLEKIDSYLLNIDEKIFNSEQSPEELITLHKELVSEREKLTKKELKEK